MNGTQHMNLQQRSLEWYNSLSQQDLDGIKERIGFAYRALEERASHIDTPRPQAPVTLMHRDRLVTMFDLQPYNVAVRVPLEDDLFGEYMGFDKSIARADMTTMFESELHQHCCASAGSIKRAYHVLVTHAKLCNGELRPLPEDLQYGSERFKRVVQPYLKQKPKGTYKGPIITL